MKLGLTVGLNYVGTGSDLAGCLIDAADWEEVLLRRGYVVERLLEKDATAAAILAKLGALVAKLTYGDILVFTYSGHGSWVPDDNGDEPDGRDEIICPWDIQEGIWITDDQIAETFSKKKDGARIIFISDSCHSGTVNRFAASFGMNTEDVAAVGGLVQFESQKDRVRFMPPELFSKKVVVHPTAAPRAPAVKRRRAASHSVLMAGCQDWEFSYDAWFGGRPNGAFTRAAIDSLASGPQTYADWYAAIRTRLPTREHPQTPAIQGRKDQKEWLTLEQGR